MKSSALDLDGTTVWTEELDVGRRHLHIDEEVRAAEAEAAADVPIIEEERIDVRPLLLVLAERNDERGERAAIDHASHRERALVSIKERPQDLDLEMAAARSRAGNDPRWRADEAEIAPEIDEGDLQIEVGDRAPERVPQVVRLGVVAAIGGLHALEVLRRRRRAREDVVVAVVPAIEDAARDGVEERLRALGLIVIVEQADVMRA